MITVADTLEIMAVIAACHHRTAPRLDDREAALVTARIWTRLFDGQNFTSAELIDAVEKRAKVLPDAPEPADVLRVARSTRNENYDRESDEQRQARQNELERKIAPEVRSITKHVSYGPARETPRLTAARAALETCQGKAECQPAIREFVAALAEARKPAKPATPEPETIDAEPEPEPDEPPAHPESTPTDPDEPPY